VNSNDHELIIKISDGTQPNELLKSLLNQNCNVVSFNEVLPSLNEIFIQQVTATNA